MLHQLGENSLAEIHLSLSVIATGTCRVKFRTVFDGNSSNRKKRKLPLAR